MSLLDPDVLPGRIYLYRLVVKDSADPGSILGPIQIRTDEIVPFSLSTVHPDPVRNVLEIQYRIPTSGLVRLGLADVTGRTMAVLEEGSMFSGRHEARWILPPRLASGLYFITLEMAGARRVKKVIVAR
jgi:hypothetical protein